MMLKFIVLDTYFTSSVIFYYFYIIFFLSQLRKEAKCKPKQIQQD